MRISVVFGATLLLVGACAPATESADRAVESIAAADIRAHVGVLAHDSMRGRDTDDVGYEMARDYVESEFRRMGLEPMNGDSYLQAFELLEATDRGSTAAIAGLSFDHPHLIAAPDWTGTRPSLSGDGLYVGHDLVITDRGGEGLEGKVAFVLAGTPAGRADEPEIAMRERAEVELALRAGAVGVVVLDTLVSEAGWLARTRRPARALADGSTPTPRPTATLGPAASRQVLAALMGREVGPVTVAPRHELRSITSWNVGGMLPGSDPQHSQEAIVFMAHLDHVGIGAPDANGDSVYNGAHDNALGVAKVLASAQALSESQLPRSVLFVMMGAEELGLLGSWYYVNNPVVPLSETVAAINHDGGLVAGARTDHVFTWGPEFSTLSEDVRLAAEETGLAVDPDKRAPFAPSAGLMYRSDHYPFLISGVPVMYLMPGFTVEGDPERGRRAWEQYLAGIHHAQADNFDPSASYASPVALTALSVRLAWRLALADGAPQTHADAPVAKNRGKPTGFFFGDTP